MELPWIERNIDFYQMLNPKPLPSFSQND